MSKVSKVSYKKYDFETTDKGQYFWLSRRDLQIESDYSNWTAILINVIQINKNTDMN